MCSPNWQLIGGPSLGLKFPPVDLYVWKEKDLSQSILVKNNKKLYKVSRVLRGYMVHGTGRDAWALILPGYWSSKKQRKRRPSGLKPSYLSDIALIRPIEQVIAAVTIT